MNIFINNQQRPITILHEGNRKLIQPGQTIRGNDQLSIFGLTKINSNIKIESKKESIINDTSYIDKYIEYIKNYPKDNIPSVGICILTKDSYELISECVNSIFNNVRYKNTKIYIFDTGTTDKNVLNFYNEIQNNSIPVQIINIGPYNFSKNYNDGINHVDTDYIFIQNNDTVAINDYISKLMKIVILPDIGVCGPRMLYKDGTIQHDGQIIYNHQLNKFAHPGHVNLKQKIDSVGSGRHYVDGITGAGLLVKKEYFKKLNGFNETYKDIYQDVEFNIKVRQDGKLTICDRDACIYHYDNTSRKKLWNDQSKLRAMHEDERFLFAHYNTKFKYIPYKKYKLSIITLVNNEKMYIDFLNDLKNQTYNEKIQIIPIPNFNREYNGCSEALNIGLDLSLSEVSILCHQDLRIPSNWIENILHKIDKLNRIDVNWGVLGMAGTSFNGKKDDGACFLTGEKLLKYYRDSTGGIKEVQCLDELCLIVKTNNKIRFDEVNFHHYHVYGADLCLQYNNNFQKNYVIDAECVHLSNGLDNLKNEDHQLCFLNDYVKLYFKWTKLFKYFRTTTIRINADTNSMYCYFSKYLKEKGIVFPENIDLTKYI